MSQTTVLDHGYVPEEHAPDPVIAHGNPTPGKVAIWLFLASEIMFFIAILGTYIVLRSGSPKLFSEHALALSKPLAGTNTLVLIFSSLTMALAVDASQKGNRKRTIACLAITLVCAIGFLGIKAVEYHTKFIHYTIVAKDPVDKKFYAYDGHQLSRDLATAPNAKVTLEGVRMLMPNDDSFNIHLVSEDYVEKHAVSAANAAKLEKAEVVRGDTAEKKGEIFTIPLANINTEINYGPWKNVFYSCYFTLTGIHAVHVIGGIIPIFLLMVLAMRGRVLPAHIEYVGLYWHFVDLVWIFLFPLLYLI